jgi:hypothetical protein
VTVLGEDIYPVEVAAKDPIAREICSSSKVVSDYAADISGSVASIKVSAVKPK